MGRDHLALAAALIAANLTLGAGLSEAWAECDSPADLEQATLQSEAVVYGEVIALKELKGGTRVEGTLQVERAYKGRYRRGDEITVSAPQEGSEAVEFQVGRSAIVYLNGVGEALETSACLGSASLDQAPVAAETRDFFGTSPGDVPLEIKARRASAIFTGEIQAAGNGYAGRYDGVMLEVKVDRALKGARAKSTLKIRIDEESCGDQAKRDWLAEDAFLGAGEQAAPFELNASYLFYVYDEEPYQVLTCHDDLQPLAEAEEDLKRLATMCRKKRCESGHDRLTRARGELKRGVISRAETSLKRCAKELPLYSKEGAITDLSLSVRVKPDGGAELLDASSRGTLGDGGVYQELGECLAGQLPAWQLEEDLSRPDLKATVTLQMKDAARGPSVVSAEATLSER